jgi:hypothetical protein
MRDTEQCNAGGYRGMYVGWSCKCRCASSACGGASVFPALPTAMQWLLPSGCHKAACTTHRQLWLQRVPPPVLGTTSCCCCCCQVHMSRVMFTNLADVAGYHGAAHLARMATAIATDEGRHEVALVRCCCCCGHACTPSCVNLLLSCRCHKSLM